MTFLATTLQKFFTVYAADQRGLSRHTITSYRDTIRLLVRYLARTTGQDPDELGVEALNADAVTQFLRHRQDERGNSPATANTRLAAIRALAGQILLDHPEHAETMRRVRAMPRRRQPRRTIAYLTPEETDALLAAPDTATWTGRRDRAMLALTVQTGLRASEVAALTTTSIRLDQPGAHVQCLGKGRKQRSTPLTTATTAVMRTYLAERLAKPGQALFPGPAGNPLSHDALTQRLKTHLAAAAADAPSLTRKSITFHGLRHTAAMRLLEAGVDITVIALWLGHEHTSTTQIYLHANMAAKQQAIDRTRPPNLPAGRYTPEPGIIGWLERL
jgi:site-specific recombinase XerD